MTDLMLTADELARLTGRKRPTAQQTWLRRNGVRFRVNDCGEVIVARSIAEKFLGVEQQTTREPDLNWRALRRIGIVAPRGEA
jgi:hypothetical protein